MKPAETHVVLSWVWNADGTAGIQALAYGDEAACQAFAAAVQPITGDPNEKIVVCPKEDYQHGLAIRTKEFH